jgi:hypothetical protein
MFKEIIMADGTKKSTKNILVCGDVVKEKLIYKNGNYKSRNLNLSGTFLLTQKGGAALLKTLLEQLQNTISKITTHKKFEVHFGLKEKVFNTSGIYQDYSVWEPYPKYYKEKNKNEKVWRMAQWMGYSKHERWTDYSKFRSAANKNSPDILVIDDRSFGYGFNYTNSGRESNGHWLEAICKGWGEGLNWIVYRMSKPLCCGDLWRSVSHNYKHKTVLIVSINDIRGEEVRVSRGISWEQSAQDLVYELENNTAIKSLLNCKYLIITFDSEGALIITNDNNKKREYKLIFDSDFMEGEWNEQFPGDVPNSMSCFCAGVIYKISQNENIQKIDCLEKGIEVGLSAVRKLMELGHGPVKNENPKLPFKEIIEDILNPGHEYSTVTIPKPDKVNTSGDSNWTIIEANHKSESVTHKPLYSISRRVALLGNPALKDIPFAHFGKLCTVDRNEIESLRIIRRLVLDYKNGSKGERPLCLAAFGPPGSGKSFGMKQIARTVLGKDVPILEFNLSQFVDTTELTGAFHQVRDAVLKGVTPFVFWDEFDSGDYKWLQYLLSPMQDGDFHERQITHPIGKCIFVFAGGVSYSFARFQKKAKSLTQKKGPDFISRLSGYLNVSGPNKRERDRNDICYPIRRAILLRSILGLKEDEELDMDPGVLTALIEVGFYKYGARSLEKILENMKEGGKYNLMRSNLPSAEVMSLHVNHKEFMKIINADITYASESKSLAPFIHEFYKEKGLKEKWLASESETAKPYQDLSLAYQEDNIAAAVRMYRNLELVGLYVIKKETEEQNADGKTRKIIEENINLLAKTEHDGWMRHKKLNGWSYGKKRNEQEKEHPRLKPYDELPKDEKDKNKDMVRNYSDILAKGGYRIVTKK